MKNHFKKSKDESEQVMEGLQCKLEAGMAEKAKLLSEKKEQEQKLEELKANIKKTSIHLFEANALVQNAKDQLRKAKAEYDSELYKTQTQNKAISLLFACIEKQPSLAPGLKALLQSTLIETEWSNAWDIVDSRWQEYKKKRSELKTLAEDLDLASIAQDLQAQQTKRLEIANNLKQTEEKLAMLTEDIKRVSKLKVDTTLLYDRSTEVFTGANLAHKNRDSLEQMFIAMENVAKKLSVAEGQDFNAQIKRINDAIQRIRAFQNDNAYTNDLDDLDDMDDVDDLDDLFDSDDLFGG